MGRVEAPEEGLDVLAADVFKLRQHQAVHCNLPRKHFQNQDHNSELESG